MAKYVNVESGNYTIRVEDGGTIVLNTGFENANPGKVIVTGDLEIQGTTTTVTTTDLVIEDNIIQLNRPTSVEGELQPLVPENIISGIEINRGAGVDDVRWVYDGSISFTDPQSNGVVGGAWVPRVENGNVIGIQAVSIGTPNTDLNLIGVSADGTPSNGHVTVKGTNDYAGSIGNLDLAIVDDTILPNPTATEIEKLNYIPNVEWVLEQISFTLTQTRQPRIQEGTFGSAETFVETQDDTVSGISQVIVGIDGVVTTTFLDTSTRIFDVTVEGNAVKSANQDENLVLFGSRHGSVEVNDSLILTNTTEHVDGLPSAGDAVIDPPLEPGTVGVKVYTKPEEPGGTGIFFVNQSSTRDELISKNKAILYSMIF